MNENKKIPVKSGEVKLHGNSAKINPNKGVSPLFSTNGLTNFYNRPYNRLDLFDDENADFCKHEVDANEK